MLQIATLTGKKGHIYTMKAVVKALEACPNMTPTFAGQDVEGIKRGIQELASQCRVRDKVASLD